MSRRGPDPKELRASLVDSGWSVAPPAADAADVLLPAEVDDRRLPNYEDGPSPVTQVDNDLQSRLKAMQRASLGDMQRPPLPPLPPPRSASRPPQSLPPPPPPSLPPRAPAAEPPLPRFDGSAPEIEAPLPRFGSPSVPDTEQPLLPASRPVSRRLVADTAESTEVNQRGDVLPSSNPPPHPPVAPRAFSEAPTPYLAAPTPSQLPSAPSLLAALRQRVRFAGGEVPLWSLLTPLVLLLALASAFVAAAVTPAQPAASAPVASPAPSVESNAASPGIPNAVASAAPVAEIPTAQPAPALPAASMDTEALEARRAEELSKDEAIALATARREREIVRVALLRQKLKRDPGLFKDAATLADLRRAAEDPLTAPDALGAMAEAPGPLSADLLYEMWTGTVARNSATELARSLVFSKEVRAKASAELAVALDLRIAETCEQNLALLPRVSEQGDRRSLALLAKLARKFGCGPNKRLDCYPCLREGKAVDDAMAAVKKRREPKPFSGK